MSPSVLSDAFAHHAWATQRLLDECAGLTPDQLATTVPGTYGSILDTMRHIVGADASYLNVMTGGRIASIDEESMTLDELRALMPGYGEAWTSSVAGSFDPEEDVVRHRDDGTDSHGTRGVRLAQALQHGTDHRSQICTALTTLGIEPPEIDVWAWAAEEGRIWVVPADS